MKIKDFLEKHVENYLFEDLKNMAAIKSTHPSGYGEAGYPMMIASLAGIELFGALLSHTNFDPKDRHAGNRYFLFYWDNCLIKVDPYCEGLATIFRQLLRNGLDHTFFTKPGIVIYKKEEKIIPTSISVEPTDKIIAVNSIKFYENLQESYKKFIRPIGIEKKAGLTNQSSMEKRLNEIIDAGTAQSEKLIDKYLADTDMTMVTRFQRILGISAPPGDIIAPPTPSGIGIGEYISTSGTVSPTHKVK